MYLADITLRCRGAGVLLEYKSVLRPNSLLPTESRSRNIHTLSRSYLALGREMKQKPSTKWLTYGSLEHSGLEQAYIFFKEKGTISPL